MGIEKQVIIENIEKALTEGNTFKKVSLGDPIPSDEDVKSKILPFDNKRSAPVSKFKSFLARKLAEKFTRAVNKDTEIIGLEKRIIASIKGKFDIELHPEVDHI